MFCSTSHYKHTKNHKKGEKEQKRKEKKTGEKNVTTQKFINIANMIATVIQNTRILTSPHLPTTSSKSKRPNDRSTIHLLTALLLLSGVRSSSAISTHPSDLTANRIGRSEPFDSDGSARAG